VNCDAAVTRASSGGVVQVPFEGKELRSSAGRTLTRSMSSAKFKKGNALWKNDVVVEPKRKMRIELHSHLQRPQTMRMHCLREGNFRDVYHTCARNKKLRVATGAYHYSQHTYHERSLGSLSTLYAFCSSWNACVAASVLPFLSGWRCMASILYLFECQL
jgi:hypothetical protein